MNIKKRIAILFYEITDFIYYFFQYKSRVIIYHHLDEKSVVSFENNIKFLLKQKYKFVDAKTFAELLFKNKSRLKSERICAITFDDGFDSIVNYALPVLKKYNINATVFINHKLHELAENDIASNVFIEKVFPRISKVYPTHKGITSEEIDLLKSNGIEIGAHTYSHPNLGLETDYEIELGKPKTYFQNRFNIALNTFAYPYGRRRNYTKEVVEELRNHGYQYAFLGVSKNPLKFNSTTYEIPRTSIPDNCSNKRLNALMSGSQDLFDYILNENREL